MPTKLSLVLPALALVLAGPASAQTTPPYEVVVRSGIKVDLSGAHGVDYLVEALYHDRLADDTVTVYLRSATWLSLSHGTNNTDPLGAACGNQGAIVWKIDRDQQAGSYVIGSYGPRLGTAYSGPIDLRTLTYDGTTPVLGTFGDNGQPYGGNAAATNNRYVRGLRAQNGEEWHVLTAWDDDQGWFSGGPNGKVRASDAVVVNLVVNPRAPVLRLSPYLAGAQFHTTPAKTYHTPVLHEQVSYVNQGAGFELFNLADSRPIWVALELPGQWTTEWIRWPRGAVLAAGQMFPFPDTRYRLHATLGAGAPLMTRTVHYLPSFPSRAENHPRPLLARDAAEWSGIVARLRGGSQLHAEAYRAIRDYGFYNGLGINHRNVARRGWNDYVNQSHYAFHNAFVCKVEGPNFDNERYAQKCKTILLNLFTLPPVGEENTLWWPNPALERVVLGIEQMYFMDAALAYDILVGTYRTEQGFAGGITPIEDLKIRDNLASQAKTILQFRDNCTTQPGEGDSLFGAGRDLALIPIAAVMPRYDSPYYGTSGADGVTPATHAWTPYPNQRVTWWESVRNRNVATPGYPDMTFRSRLWVVYPDSGVYSGPVNYQTIMYPTVQSFANIAKLVDGPSVYPNIERYLGNKVNAGTAMPQVVNSRFPFAAQARQNLVNLTSNSLRDGFSLSYFQ